MTRSVTVHLAQPDLRYDLTIRTGALDDLHSICRGVVPSKRALIVADDAVVNSHAARAHDALANHGFDLAITTISAVEAKKTLDTTAAVLTAALKHRLDRQGCIISIGGGLTGDVAGFAAATYLRGIAFLQVPTTLLAMVDASTGGKTGVNVELPDNAGTGKNLVGAFWQPRAVIIDPATLETLDDRQFRCGLAESIKHAIIADAALLDELERTPTHELRANHERLEALIEQSVPVKVDLVQRDEREGGVRALLNLGHTFAHAIEPIAELGLFHGEAVAIGLIAACSVARQLDRMTDDQQHRITRIIDATGLPIQTSRPVDVDALMNRMRFDKNAHDQLRLVVPRGIGAADVIDDVPDHVIRQAWSDVMPTSS